MVVRLCIGEKGMAGSFIKKVNSEIAAPKRFFRRMQEAFVSGESF